MITPFPGAIETKPGSATVPFFSIKPVILDLQSGKVLEGNNVGEFYALGIPGRQLLELSGRVTTVTLTPT